MDFVKIAKEVIKSEAESLIKLSERIDGNFNKAVNLLYNCKGKVILTGVGKSGHIAGKIAATFSSTGTPAFFLNPMEGMHGDIGVIMEKDVVIAISKTGETEELLNILFYPKRLNIPIIAITSDSDSSLAKLSTTVLILPQIKEVCPMNLAPTTSTTMTLVLGDALAVALMEKRKFKKEQFAMFHPGGSLGRQLKKVYEVMTPKSEFAIGDENITIRDALKLIIKKNKGLCVFTNKEGDITGILTDGDLKRLLLKIDNLLERTAKEVMIRNPKKINRNSFVLEAVQKMEGKYTQLIVVDDNDKLCGVIHIHDILSKKII